MELSENKDQPAKDDLEWQEQIERGSLFTHTALSRQSARLNEIESFLYGIIDILTKKGITPPEELQKAVEDVRKEMIEKGELSNPGIALRVDGEEEEAFIPVNCDERLHICKAVCCQLEFALSAPEVESGKVKWDLGRPYHIRRGTNCYCAHLDQSNKKCTVYNHRPSVCKKYSCANDKRIWKDFEKMELNEEWIKENIRENKMRFTGAPMFTEQQVVHSYEKTDENQ